MLPADRWLSWLINGLPCTRSWFDSDRTNTSVAVAHSLGPVFQQGFESQFGIDWIPYQTFVRLVIFSATSAENGAFTCQVVAETNSSMLGLKAMFK